MLFYQKDCVRYSTNIDSVPVHYLTSEKAGTMCYQIYYVKLVYIWSLESGLSRHTVFGITRRLI